MNADAAVQAIRLRAAHCAPRIAVILGSGWSGLTLHINNGIRIGYADLPGFPHAGVAGHSGELWLGEIGAHAVAVMSGRRHAYEDGAVDGMRLSLQTLQTLGCEILVQTNAAGSLRADMAPPSLMVLSDHINLPQRSPLVGASGSERFVPMADAYDPALRQSALATASRLKQPLAQGIYAWAFGPQFETPAEIRMLAKMGADAVGMSTVPETILARFLGMRVLALSLITNMAAGLSDEALSHAHTLAQAQASAEQASGLLAAIISDLQP